MNYTGRPSISGCRPVLSLYPTHRFCQYLLLIFITFTNSFLFNRAFSTNSRKPSQSKALPLGELAGASPTERARLLTENHRHRDSIALTKSLPIAAPAVLSCRACPLRHCFAMPPLPKGEALAGRATFHWTPEARQDAKGRSLLAGTGASLYNLSVSLRSTAPLVGEPLAEPFTLRGLPRPLLQGEVASRQR